MPCGLAATLGSRVSASSSPMISVSWEPRHASTSRERPEAAALLEQASIVVSRTAKERIDSVVEIPATRNAMSLFLRQMIRQPGEPVQYVSDLVRRIAESLYPRLQRWKDGR